jgi:peptidoglycan/xylan/chitin deacetylase (PgdA/CDA1 family)
MTREIVQQTTHAAAAALSRTGVLQRRFQRNAALRILGFHGVCADADAGQPWVPDYFVTATRFAEHLEMAQRLGPIVSLPEYLPRLAKSSGIDGKEQPAAIAITFDDVPACTLEHALPVLDRLGIRASFYVSTGHARSGRLFVADMLRLIRVQPELVSPGARRALASLLEDPQAHKRLALPALRTILAEAEIMLHRRVDSRVREALRCVNWGEVRGLASAGHDIGGHTVDHAILARQTDALRREQIMTCAQDIRREIGRQPVGFAYPNGAPGDFDERDHDSLRAAGFTHALTTTPGPVTGDGTWFALPRTCVGMGHSAGMLAVELSGMLDARRRRQVAQSGPVPAAGRASEANATRAPASMRQEEYAVLERLLHTGQPERTLEIGMAGGGSTERICAYLHARGGGRHTAIDPYQLAPDGWAGRGVRRIEQAGLSAHLELITKPDFLALPELVANQRRFDFVLIDGWHAFDFTQLDFFYADLLLRPGGLLAIHDTNWPAVHRACRFLETHKPYERIGPPISVTCRSFARRAGRRMGQVLRGPAAMRAARARRREWFALAAYRKRADHTVPNAFYAPF